MYFANKIGRKEIEKRSICMKDVLVLDDLEKIKAISQSYRLKILKCFEGEKPATVKQIAEKMNEPHAKVNYHIKVLYQAGILQLVGEKVKQGIVEKYYLPSAKTFLIAKKIMSSGAEEIKDFSDGESCFLTELEKKELTEILKNKVKEYIRDKKNKKNPNSSPYKIVTSFVPQRKE